MRYKIIISMNLIQTIDIKADESKKLDISTVPAYISLAGVERRLTSSAKAQVKIRG